MTALHIERQLQFLKKPTFSFIRHRQVVSEQSSATPELHWTALFTYGTFLMSLWSRWGMRRVLGQHKHRVWHALCESVHKVSSQNEDRDKNEGINGVIPLVSQAQATLMSRFKPIMGSAVWGILPRVLLSSGQKAGYYNTVASSIAFTHLQNNS